MATRRKRFDEPIGEPQVEPYQAVKLLTVQIGKGKDILAKRPIDPADYSTWELVTKNILEKAFGTNSPNVTRVQSVGKYGSFPGYPDPHWWDNHRAESLSTQIKLIEGLVELLNTEVQLQNSGHISAAPSPQGFKIFLVHGHDERVLHEVARFLEKLKQDIVILREQPNEDRTIIEKFETYSEVGYSIVLLTPDDKGAEKSVSFENQRARARQNVILELGYFLGKLGRSRVCAIYSPGVEVPSDYSGVLFVEFDAGGGWRFQLAKELKAAGLPIDMNEAV